MELVLAFVILYLALAVVWVVSLFAYNAIVGGLDIGGPLGMFALKSAGLVAVATIVIVLPFGGFLVIGVWWLGLVFLFGMEFWDAKILVAIIWGITFLLRLAVFALVVKANQG
jgi:hypothetical protein